MKKKPMREAIKEETGCKFVYVVRDIYSDFIVGVASSKFRARQMGLSVGYKRCIILRRELDEI